MCVPLVHVQQKAVNEEMWNLCPSFVLKWFHPDECNASPADVGDWKWISKIQNERAIADVDEDTEEDGVKKEIDVHAILEHLQRECCTYSHMQICDLYDRYWILTSGKDYPGPVGLVCSIPVLREQNKFLVDNSAISGRQYDLPWTHIYSPTRADQVIGNSSSCLALLHWLQQWKMCHDGRSSSKQTSKLLSGRKSKSENEDWSDPDFFCGKITSHTATSQHFHLSEEEDLPAALLHGPHGTGKTAAVYACSKELGFKVCEVNAGCIRSKPKLLQKLREATLSHQVQPFVQVGMKRPSTSSNVVILLEEVDVVFCEDRGFFQAVEEIISSTKRPVILTCSDPLEFQVKFLKLHFSPPPQLELAVHLSLLSLANGWPLPLHLSSQLSQYFLSDIRKAMLYMQFMLSWKPVNPMSINLSDSVGLVNLTNISFPKCRRHPWRASNQSSHIYIQHHSELELMSMLNDFTGEVDCIKGASWQKDLIYRPWVASLKPSLLDEFPDCSLPNSCFSQDVLRTLCELSGVHPTFSDTVTTSQSKLNTQQNVIGQFFSNHWQLSWAVMATDGLPFLELMYNLENHRRSREPERMRRSRHYFHPHHTDLNILFR